MNVSAANERQQAAKRWIKCLNLKNQREVQLYLVPSVRYCLTSRRRLT